MLCQSLDMTNVQRVGMNSQRMLRKKLYPTRSRRMANAANEPKHLQKSIWKLYPARVFVKKYLALRNTGVVPNIIWSTLLNRLGVRRNATKCAVTLASGTSLNYTGLIQDKSITFASITSEKEFLLVDSFSWRVESPHQNKARTSQH